MDPNTLIIIIVISAITLLLLAFMAGILKLNIDWTESRFPRINLHFEKDRQLLKFNQLQKSRGKKSITEYKVSSCIGRAKIQYGANTKTWAKKSLSLTPTKDSISEYYLFASNTDFEIKLLSGFQKQPAGYKNLINFPNWDGSSSLGSLTSLYKLTLDIPSLLKGEEHLISYEVKQKIRYIETIEGKKNVYHGFYYRMDADTERAVLVYEIPKGEVSKIYKLMLQSQIGEESLFEEDIPLEFNKVFTLKTGFGLGWIEESKNTITLHWVINDHLVEGQLCRLIWYAG